MKSSRKRRGTSEKNDNENEVSPSNSKKNLRKFKRRTESREQINGHESEETEIEDNNDNDNEVSPSKPKKNLRKPKKRTESRKHINGNESKETQIEQNNDNENEVSPSKPKKNLRKSKRRAESKQQINGHEREETEIQKNNDNETKSSPPKITRKSLRSQKTEENNKNSEQVINGLEANEVVGNSKKSKEKRSQKHKNRQESEQKEDQEINGKKKSNRKENQKIDESNFIESLKLLREENHNNFYGFEDKIEELKEILNGMIKKGESKCVLITGGRGYGKTALLQKCLSKINLTDKTYIINLNGFVHGNDNNTIKYIANQLNIEAKNIHEIVNEIVEICNQLKRSIIIVMDEFDVFCHRHQLLVYNIFDAYQKCKSICIIGLSIRSDAFELLEKRVKSRISMHNIIVSSPFVNVNQYIDFASNFLIGFDLTDQLKETLKMQYSENKSIRSLKKTLLEYLVSLKTSYETNHNQSHKLLMLPSLSTYELCVLILAVRYTEARNTGTFNCANLMESIHRISSLAKSITKSILFKIIQNLIDYDFILKINSARKINTIMTEWTLLKPNIEESMIKNILDKNEHLMSIDVKQVFMNY